MKEELIEELGKLTAAARTLGRETLGAAAAAGKEAVEAGLEAGERLKMQAIELMDKREEKKVWSGAASIPSGSAPDTIVPSCLVLEGGSFRGLYTAGVLDVLMEHGINLQTVIGTSAGALNGYNYVAGEIGRSARIDLCYRHDHRFFSPRTTLQNKGVVGFDFILEAIEEELPFNSERFMRADRRFVVTNTDCELGEVVYQEKGQCSDIVKAVRASASMPFVSEPVELDGRELLDGGCCIKIPYQWAIDEGYEKILVIRTRTADYVRPEESKRFRELAGKVYGSRPALVERLCSQAALYNSECEELRRLEAAGRLMMLCPSGSIQVGTLEGDMEKLGALYLLGRRDTEYMLPQIKAYLGC